MLLKEYRICMPISVEEYHKGQLYMIAKHSNEQSEKGDGVEVVKNEPTEDPVHGKGQYTEKRIHLLSRLPGWIKAMLPVFCYVTEKAWNYYPFTITEYTCSVVPGFSIHIKSCYENNNGSSENCLNLPEDQLEREVVHLDIAYDEFPEKHYKESEDCKKFKSVKTGRGPLEPGWRDATDPIMCSYKAVEVKFELWGFQTRVEGFTHSVVRDILLVGHRQAFSWIDEWFGMSIDDIRNYENKMNAETNQKVMQAELLPSSTATEVPVET
ncbi:cytoplasmic phosphatidylinositol transfer protein 1-like [Lineus longissimus]|uniref:cytoplasmic phosphatidylinositol transfer protein 1-like n=1 Tax=Lineus longissimus TaxID=88925 RepID=UPI002B4E6ACB